MVDWAHKIDPLRSISMHGITERCISDQKGDESAFVRILLDDLENRISMQFSRVSYRPPVRLCIPETLIRFFLY